VTEAAIEFRPADPARFAEAIRRIDAANSEDPNRVHENGLPLPRELIYSRWLTEWVLRLQPNASEALRLAARAQHLRRWEVPRNQFPMTRAGYLQWREGLKRQHARLASEILQRVGYEDHLVQRVHDLILKKDFRTDPEGAVLEDALCLVFLERQFGELAAKTDRDKMVGAVRKAWGKMTPRGHAAALELDYPSDLREIVQAALTNPNIP
jgi:hypothetical protein